MGAGQRSTWPRHNTSLGCENLHRTHNRISSTTPLWQRTPVGEWPRKGHPAAPLQAPIYPQAAAMSLHPTARKAPLTRALAASGPEACPTRAATFRSPLRLGCELTMQQKAEPTPARPFARRRTASAHHRTRVVKRLLGNRNGRRRQVWTDSALAQSAMGMPRALARKGACAGARARARSRARAKAFAHTPARLHREQLQREHGRQHMPQHPHSRT